MKSSARKKRKRVKEPLVRLAGLCMVLVLCFTVAVCSSSRPDDLKVGMELSYPPFEMTDKKGNPAGISVDMARELGAFLHRQVKIENISFDGLIPALKTGRIDLVISSMTATDERRKSIDFSDPYVRTGLCLLVGRTSDVHTIADADRPGKTIAVKKGTTGHAYAAENLKNARILVLDREAAAVLEVVQGKADGFIYDQMSVYKHWQRNKDTTRAILTPFKVEYWAVGIRKGNDDLRKKVNDFLATFRKEKGFDRLADHYLKEQKEAFEQLGSPFLFDMNEPAGRASGAHQ